MHEAVSQLSAWKRKKNVILFPMLLYRPGFQNLGGLASLSNKYLIFFQVDIYETASFN